MTEREFRTRQEYQLEVQLKKEYRSIKRVIKLAVGVGIIGVSAGFLAIYANYCSLNEKIKVCNQQAIEQQFSPDLCIDDCFSSEYFKLQEEYNFESLKSDVDLAYKLAKDKCGGKNNGK